MPGISRIGLDTAGGVITGPPMAATVLVNGAPVAVLGAMVAPHGTGPHLAATMIAASATVFAGGLPVCRAGDAASCGDTATGSSDVTAG